MKLKIKKISYVLVPTVACFLLIMVYFSNISDNNSYSTPENKISIEHKNNVEFVTAKLPTGHEIKNIAYDNGKTIFYIINDSNNQIVLTTEVFYGKIEQDAFQEIYINDTIVYGLAKNDFNFIMYQKDNVLYTLTSRFNYKDLIELSRSMI